jgi:hypothetical protein
VPAEIFLTDEESVSLAKIANAERTFISFEKPHG